MSFIDGKGVVQGPAKAIEMTPEQEQAAAAKLERARAARAKRKAEQIAEPATVAEQPIETTAESQASERPRLPWQSDGEPENDGPRLPDESTWPVDPESGARVSPKLYALKQQERREVEARERGDEQPAGKLAFTGNVGSDAEYEAAKRAYDAAEQEVRALLAEQAAFTGKMQDAIEQQDLATIKTLRERQRELPDLIFAARMGAAQAKLTYFQMRAARARIAKQEARAAAAKVSADFLYWQRKVGEAQSAAQSAEYTADDSVRDVGTVQRELDALKAEALAQAIGPAAHRVPMGVHESGADLSNLAPLG